MRIVAAPADFEGCGTYRILLPCRRLKARGHDVGIPLRADDPRIGLADVLLVQRQSDVRVLELVRACRARGMPVIYELDDNLHSLSPLNPASQWYGPGKPATKMVERFLQEVDAVIVSTKELADEYRRFNDHMFVCRNAIDDEHFARFAPKDVGGDLKRKGQVRIGWAGSFTHRGDLLSIIPALVDVMRADPRVRFITIGDSFTDLFPTDLKERVEWIVGSRTSPQINPDLIQDDLLGLVAFYGIALRADFDIAIAPLEHTLFNRCKSDLKLKEYGLFGVPVVATRFGPYAEYQAQAGEPVVTLAAEKSEWVAALQRLINSPCSRTRLAAANVEHVRRHHLLSSRIDAWEYALTSVAVYRAATLDREQPRSAATVLKSRRRSSGAPQQPSALGPLIINDAGLLGDALSALPLIHRVASDCAKDGTSLKVMLRHPEVASLIAPSTLQHIRVLPWYDDRSLQEAVPASRVIRLSVLDCLKRYGRLLHMMQAHYVEAGYEHTEFALPPVDPALASQGMPIYDFVVSPFSRSDADHHKLWPLNRWQTVIDHLSKDFRICVVGHESEKALFDNADACYGQSLREVASLILRARQGVLSIDNGISHLTHLVGANHLLLYPAALSFCWVRNTNRNALHLVGRPLDVPIDAVMQAIDILRSEVSEMAAA